MSSPPSDTAQDERAVLLGTLDALGVDPDSRYCPDIDAILATDKPLSDKLTDLHTEIARRVRTSGPTGE